MQKDYISVSDSEDDLSDNEHNNHRGTYKNKRTRYGGDDFPSMLVNLLTSINIKIAIFIFIIGMIIFSDMFVLNVLSSFKDAVNNIQTPTTNGTVIQLICLTIGYICIDLLVQGKYI